MKQIAHPSSHNLETETRIITCLSSQFLYRKYTHSEAEDRIEIEVVIDPIF